MRDLVDARAGSGHRVTFGREPDGDLYIEEGTYTIVEPGLRLTRGSRLTGSGLRVAVRFNNSRRQWYLSGSTDDTHGV